jgi:hypothetical protein
MIGIRLIKNLVTAAEMRSGKPKSSLNKSRKNHTPESVLANASFKKVALMKGRIKLVTNGTRTATRPNIAEAATALTTVPFTSHESAENKIDSMI